MTGRKGALANGTRHASWARPPDLKKKLVSDALDWNKSEG
jgi:hypothetical protein